MQSSSGAIPERNGTHVAVALKARMELSAETMMPFLGNVLIPISSWPSLGGSPENLEG